MFLTQLARRPRLPYLYYVDFSRHDIDTFNNPHNNVYRDGDNIIVRGPGTGVSALRKSVRNGMGFFIVTGDHLYSGAAIAWIKNSNAQRNYKFGWSAGEKLIFCDDPNGFSVGYEAYNGVNNYVSISSLSVKQAYYLASGIKLERWLNYTGSWNDAEEHIANNSPDYVTKIREFYVQDAGLDMFLQRLTGTVVFVADMNVRFAISSDDQSKLRLKVNNRNYGEICSVQNYTLINEIDKYPEQISEVIEIKAGDKVEFEVIHKEGDNDDHLTVHIAPETGDVFAPLAFLEV